MAGSDAALGSCDCSLEGVTSYCAEKYASKPWSEIKESCGDVTDEAKKSSERAATADDGATMWVTVEGVKYVYSDGAAYGGHNTAEGFGAWAARVMAVSCQALARDGAAPRACDAYAPPH